MNIQEVSILSMSQKVQIIELWNNEYPISIAYSSVDQFETYLAKLEDKRHILLLSQEGLVMGWLIHFMRDDDRWFAMILDASLQGMGYGSKLLALAKERNTVLNGWVIDHNNEVKQDGTAYLSPLLFYKKNGFDLLHDESMKNLNITGIKVRWKQR